MSKLEGGPYEQEPYYFATQFTVIIMYWLYGFPMKGSSVLSVALA